jgi:hypothetical protein
MITMKVKEFTQRNFLESYNKLMHLDGIGVADKMNLVRFNRQLLDEIGVARDSITTEEDAAEVLEQDVAFDIAFDFTMETLAEQLNAADLANLYPMLNKEDV